MAKIKRKNQIALGGKTYSFDGSYSLTTSHVEYSGYGAHANKIRKAERRNRKIEEKRARLYGE